MYQNGYLHGGHSRFLAKSAIYTAVGCQHKIAICMAAVPEPIQYTWLPCVHIKSLFTRQPFKSQVGYIHCCRLYTKRYLHGRRSRAKSAIYMYTLLTDVYIKLLFTRQPFKSQIFYIHCCRVYIHNIVFYTAAVQTLSVQKPIQD